MTGSFVLASSSRRRRELLADAGFQAIAIPPKVDDGMLRVRAHHARADCCALAWFKGVQIRGDAAALDRLAPHAKVILAADTVCVLGCEVLGKPRDMQHARSMIESACNHTQSVVTGVCLIDIATGRRTMTADSATVAFGSIPSELLEAHLQRGAWRGCAGGYNLQEVVAEGWPVQCVGDPTTVVGLPMAILAPLLARVLSKGGLP